MGILGVEQPNFIQVDTNIRLRKYNGECDFALEWYRDKQTLLLVNGNENPYDIKKLYGMYNYQNSHSELYFIQYNSSGIYETIGDVSFNQKDITIVIGKKEYQRKNIGYLVILQLVKRAKELKYDTIYVDEIYDYNIGSQKCFEKVGFRSYEKTDRGYKYFLTIDD